MNDFFASHGQKLVRFSIDDGGTLQPAGELELDSPIHYVWPHTGRRLLYVASSKRWFTPYDEGHMLTVVEVPEDGPMRKVGNPVPLPTRPIHITLDRTNRFLVCVFNIPSGIEVRPIHSDGSIGAPIAQPEVPELGPFPHHVLFSPDNRWVLVTVRGNPERPGRPEDPGSLRRFSFDDGRLKLEQIVAPKGGIGFGPRHCDFHPSLPCIYVSVELQNQLHVYRYGDGGIEDSPRQVFSTLSPAKAPLFPQHAGAVHVDEGGDFVYVVNRDDLRDGTEPSHITGDNTMAAFRIDPASGAVSPPVHSEIDAYHVRTFSLSLPFLVAASQADIVLPAEAGPQDVPASLTVFRIAEGRLSPVHRTPMPTKGSMLFWCGFPRAYGAAWE